MQFVNLTLHLAKADGMTELDSLSLSSKHISEQVNWLDVDICKIEDTIAVWGHSYNKTWLKCLIKVLDDIYSSPF